MHVEVAVHTDLTNHKKFTEWINSRDYGSRPFDRVWMVHDIAIQEQHLPNLLADLKWYHRSKMCGGWKSKTVKKIINFLFKRFGLKVIDMEGIEKTPEKWFTPIKWDDKNVVTHACYLEVIGGFPDMKDKTDKTGIREEI